MFDEFEAICLTLALPLHQKYDLHFHNMYEMPVLSSFECNGFLFANVDFKYVVTYM